MLQQQYVEDRRDKAFDKDIKNYYQKSQQKKSSKDRGKRALYLWRFILLFSKFLIHLSRVTFLTSLNHSQIERREKKIEKHAAAV